MSRPIVLGVTGASGAVYARRLLTALLAQGREVHLAVSGAGDAVFQQELGEKLTDILHRFDGPLRFFDNTDFMAPMASGSFLTQGMVVCPCSGGTLSAVANGASGNLIQRAADVHLKERRRLILVPRETPLSEIHCRNLLELTRAGATILPASPGFYHRPESIEDLASFIVTRVLDQFGLDAGLMRRWGESR